MRMIKNPTFWYGAVFGVVAWQILLPRFAPNIKAKLPLG